ncbi:MAG TPA: hypothetical protein VNW46_00510 [Gemmatimonadaceae bacterium]|jgi:hypothetical protein|nr:hypothetical protein [Gemmatimonadaceae bacterium]
MRGDREPEDGPEAGGDATDLPWPLLDRYLSDSGSTEERRALETWLSEHPASLGGLASLRSFVREPGPPTLTTGADDLWAGMARRMASRRRLRRWTVGSELGAIAAGLLIAAVLLGRGGVGASGHRDTTIVATVGKAVANTAAVSVAESVDGAADTAHVASGTLGRARRTVGSAGRHAHGAREVSRPRDDGVPPVEGDVGARAVSLADDRPGAADTHWP